MKVKLTANARRRLQQIRDYQKEQGNTAKGRRIGRKILTEAKKLENYPELGQVETNLESEGKDTDISLIRVRIRRRCDHSKRPTRRSFITGSGSYVAQRKAQYRIQASPNWP